MAYSFAVAPAVLLTVYTFLFVMSNEDPEREGHFKAPIGVVFRRLIHFLSAFIIRRPEDSISLPELTIIDAIIDQEKNMAESSNAAYEEFEQLNRMNAANRKLPAAQSKADNAGTWGCLTKAQQFAMHPHLVDIMHHVRNSKPSDEHDDESADQLPDYEAIQQWEFWREMLAEDNGWELVRVRALIKHINR